MMSPATIEEMSRKAARDAARNHRTPYIMEAEDIAALKAGHAPNLIPFIGDHCPRRFRRTANRYFVDSSGFGSEGEPALTLRAFIEKLRPGFAYAVVEAGQFQVYVQEYSVGRLPTNGAQSVARQIMSR